MNLKTICLVTCLASSVMLSARENVVVPDSLGFDRTLDASPASLLRGRISGVRVSSVDGNPNGQLNVNIRGVNTLRGDSQPLWIIDGAVVNTSANDNLDAFWQFGQEGVASPLRTMAAISAYDIESVEVIKNASATALYGAAGANGVIIITTKLPERDGVRVDWHSDFGIFESQVEHSVFGTAVGHSHHVSVSANRNNTNYYLSANYRNIDGVAPGSGNNNAGILLGFDSHANKSVHFGMKSLISLGHNGNASAVGRFGTSSLMSNLRGTLVREATQGWIDDYDNNADDYKFSTTITLDVKFAKSLVWKNVFGVDYHYLNRYFWFGNGTQFGLESNGAASILSNSLLTDRFNSSLNFDRFFSEHHLTASAGFEQNAMMSKRNQIPATDFFDHSLRAKGINLSSKMIKLFRFQNDFNRYAAFATAAYDWKDAVGASLVVRAEFLPRYLDSEPVKYYGIQPFVNLEKLLGLGDDVLSTLRIEGGYGASGLYEYRPVSFGGDIAEGTEPFYDNLRNLRTKEVNAGLVLGFNHDRFTLGVNVYDRRTTDTDDIYCFGKNKPNVSKVGGDYLWDYDERFLFSSRNSEIENKGVEIDFNGDVIRNGSLVWNINANLAVNDNCLKTLSVGDAADRQLGSGLVANAAIEGEPVGAIYGYERSSNSYKILGNPIPKMCGGLTSTLKAGKFSAEIQLDGAAGFDIVNLNLLAAAQEPPYGLSADYVEKGDFLRLAHVALGYEFAPRRVKAVRSVGFKLTANNLYTLTDYSGWNPDVNVYGLCPATAGMDYSSYPPFTSVVLGVNVKF